jgi:hypothetical protein
LLYYNLLALYISLTTVCGLSNKNNTGLIGERLIKYKSLVFSCSVRNRKGTIEAVWNAKLRDLPHLSHLSIFNPWRMSADTGTKTRNSLLDILARYVVKGLRAFKAIDKGRKFLGLNRSHYRKTRTVVYSKPN